MTPIVPEFVEGQPVKFITYSTYICPAITAGRIYKGEYDTLEEFANFIIAEGGILVDRYDNTTVNFLTSDINSINTLPLGRWAYIDEEFDGVIFEDQAQPAPLTTTEFNHLYNLVQNGVLA